MVRTMVAAMVEAGKGKLSAHEIAAILRAGNRHNAPAPAPPGGLCLVEVRY
jgi:tRNA U38,U39,U40 pseudouridine synthase TruA